jgi:serine/threonine-protein kinase HipA
MKLAKEIDINVPDVEIRNIDGLEFLLIKRFDREVQNGKIRRILQEDFAQSLGVQSRDKYDVTVKDCLWVLNQTSEPAKAKMEFVKRVVFNYLIGNTDAHSKNFSISFNNGKIGFTPAYDLLCSSVYDCDQRIAMKIGKGKYYKDIEEKDWELFAQDIDISPKIVKAELERQKSLIEIALKEVLKGHVCEIGNKILEYIQNNS